MIPLYSPDSLGLPAAIGLFDSLGLALLGGCLPLPLSLRDSTKRTFSGYRTGLGTISLDIPVIYLVFHKSARHLFSPEEWNGGCWRV